MHTKINYNTKKTHCKEGHPFDEENTYHTTKGTRECRLCSSKLRRAWEKANPEKILAKSRKAKYGLTDDEFKAMLEKQGGLCKICVTSKATDVDHCHATGRVRGLLCRACNNALGLLKENTETLQSAIEYLKEKT